MSELGCRLLIDFTIIYGGLITIYFVVGALVSFTNRRLDAARKIQKKTTPDELVVRDMAQSTFSLAHISLFLALGLSMRELGFGFQPWGPRFGPIAPSFILSLVLFDAWFYWGHRLLHTRLLYRIAHHWHHAVTTPNVWSNNSETFLDNLILQSYWMIAPLVFPAPTLVFLVHKIYDQVSGMIGHSGYHYNAAMARFPSPLLAVIHHDQHHRYFKYNFATHFVVWDRVMHTLHPGYDPLLENGGSASQDDAIIEPTRDILSLNP
jgi:Delta7-sterol 5-desaturase